MVLKFAFRAFTLILAIALVAPVEAQILYSQDFDADDTANWTVNDGPTDEYADFFFDYSTVGIPSAPNSSGSTRGMRLAANIFGPLMDNVGVFGGFSVSPTGQSFTGDYVVKFDMWANYIGAFDAANPGGGTGGVASGANGSSTLSIMGIMSSGNVANYAGAGDGVFFAATPDGGSGADYRAYSVERLISYQIPPLAPNEDIDMHATYFAGSRNNTAALYADNFGGATVPAAQTAAVIDGDPLGDTQYGTTAAGTLGFEWHEVQISKVGNLITWTVSGIDLISVDITNIAVPTGGTNILFGQGDINAGLSTDPNFKHVQFTLFDNIVVEALSAAADNADFVPNDLVDGSDFLVWQRNNGISDGTADRTDGDATGDGNVNAADLAVWTAQYGTNPNAAAVVAAVPEPASVVLAGLALAGLSAVRRRK
ncbi:MAG: PEP-CTERM sorting domain-containing protein [Pirellulales bacterium]|nr:PEP-CTERM sorting domain-containing protein [Pirellulales bacterium]